MSTEDIINFDDLNAYAKSSTNISRIFAKMIRNKVLGENEELSSKPESVINLLTSGIGDLASNAFYEQAMYVNEMHPNTAILNSTLLSKLLDDELAGIFATPASGVFFLAFPKKILLEAAVIDESNPNSIGVKKVRINKECRFSFLTGESYTLDHSIDIFITKYDTEKPVFKANFDLSNKTNSGMTVIENSVLNVRPMNYMGVDYIAIDVPARNVFRDYHNSIINSENVPDLVIPFTKELMGFEVLYRENVNSSYIKLNGYPEGTDSKDGYEYDITYDGDSNYVKIMFGKTIGSFKPNIRSDLKVIIYTTDGIKGNLEIPNIDENVDNLSFALQQDLNDPYEAALLGMKTLCSVRVTNISGGKSQKTFEEIREYVINKGNDNKILSYADLERKVNNYKGCSTEKIRHDLDLDIRVNTTLYESNGKDLISSGFGNIIFDFEEIRERSEIKSRLIKPTDVFRLDEKEKVYKYQKNPIDYKKYIESYGKNEFTEISFPFFIKWQNTSVLSADVFDLSAKDTYFTKINFYDSISLDNITVTNMRLYRNPSNEFPTQAEIDKEIEGYYMIDFYAIIGDSLLEPIKDYFNKQQKGILAEDEYPIFNIRLAFSNKTIRQSFYSDAYIEEIDESNKRLKMKCILKTNNNIKEDGGICFTDYSLIPLPIPAVPIRYYYLDQTVDMQVVIMFNNKSVSELRDVNQDRYLSNEEKEIGFYVGIIYDIPDVVFGRELTKYFNFINDVKLKPKEFLTYEQDEYLKYTENVYEYDEKGNVVIKDAVIQLADGTEYTTKQMSILHKIGDYKFDSNGNRIIAYKKGDVKRYANGKPIPKGNKPGMIGIIRNFPWYDRIYNVNTKYFDVRDAYYNNTNTIQELQSIVLNGIRLSMGFKRTSGESSLYFIKNLITGETEPLDNIAITIEFGVKFDSSMTESDQLFNVEKIIEKTKQYIYNVTNEFNVNNLTAYLKDEIPSIIHLEHYKLNNYPSNIAQTITKKIVSGSIENEVLSIRSRIDEEKTDILNKQVYFKPGIVVKIL